MFRIFNIIIAFLRKEYRLYRYIIFDHRTPLVVKTLYVLIVVYVLSPFDIIPDIIPFSGILDDLLVIPVIIKIAGKLTPAQIVSDARRKLEPISKSA